MVEPEWGNRPISGITRSAVKTWISESKSITGKTVSASRMKQAYVLLKLLLDHAVDMNLINRNPIQSGSRSGKNLLPRIEVQKQKRALEKDELLALANSAGDYRLLILVAGLLGSRWAELVATTPEDFDFKKKNIIVSKSLSEISGRFELVTPKSGKARVLPLLNILEKDLKALCLATPEGEPIFKSRKGGSVLCLGVPLTGIAILKSIRSIEIIPSNQSSNHFLILEMTYPPQCSQREVSLAEEFFILVL